MDGFDGWGLARAEQGLARMFSGYGLVGRRCEPVTVRLDNQGLERRIGPRRVNIGDAGLRDMVRCRSLHSTAWKVEGFLSQEESHSMVQHVRTYVSSRWAGSAVRAEMESGLHARTLAASR